MSRWTLLLALSTASLGCTDLLGDKDDEDEDEDDDDGGEDGDDGGGGGGGIGGSACSSVFPLDEVGLTLSYEHDNEESGFFGDYTLTYSGKETLDGEEVWRMDGDYHMESTEYDYESDYWNHLWYRCDSEGVHLLASDFEQVTVNSGTTSEYWSQTVYTEPGLTMPSSISVGDAWTYAYVSESTSSASEGTVESTYSVEYEVVGQQSVTVPAGTFDAYEIAYDVEDSTWSWFAAEGVGTVASDDNELVSISN